MDGLTLEVEIVGISSVSKSLVLDEKVNVKHYTSEMIHILNILKSWVKM